MLLENNWDIDWNNNTIFLTEKKSIAITIVSIMNFNSPSSEKQQFTSALDAMNKVCIDKGLSGLISCYM